MNLSNEKCYREAVLALETSLQIDRLQAKTYAWLAYAQRSLKRVKAAVENAERGVALDPDDPETRMQLGMALSLAGRHEDAVGEADAAVKLAPASAHYAFCRARILAGHGRLEDALAGYRRSLALDRDQIRAHLGVAFALCGLRRYEDAMAVAERLAAEGPADGGLTRIIAGCLRGLGRIEEAREKAAGFLEVDESDKRHLALAFLCAVTGEQERARMSLEAYDGPWEPWICHFRARIHAILGQADQALEWLGRAVEKGYRLPAELVSHPDLASLAKDPQYRALLNRLRR